MPATADNAAQPALTRQPWAVLGVSKWTWYRLPSRPEPVETGLPGRSSYYRVADLLAWAARLPSRKQRRSRS